MPTSNAQRFLTDHDGDNRALALRMFWGFVLEAFRNQTLLWNTVNGDSGVGGSAPGPIVSSKVVNEGKAWRFPIIGEDPEPEYHTPGVEMLGMQVEVDEGTITIDETLVSHFDVPWEDTIISHFDVMRPFATKLGRSLAVDFDKKLFITGAKAAHTSGVTKNGMTIHNGGNVVGRSGSSTSAAYAVSLAGATAYEDDLGYLAQLLDEDNVPEEGRYLFITPYIRRVLNKLPDRAFSQDFDAAGQNQANRRVLGLLQGFQVMKPTKHMPLTEITGHKFSKYNGDFSAGATSLGETAGLVLCGADEGSGAIGYVAAGGPMPHMHFDERRETWFMKAKMLVGAGVLAPWNAGVLRVRDD